MTRRFSKTLPRAGIFALISALAACGGGGGGGGGAPGAGAITNELAASNLRLLSQDVRAGYPLELRVAIQSQGTIQDLAVSVYATNKDDLDAGAESPRQFFLGGRTLAEVVAGEGDYQFSVDVPVSVGPSGNYLVQVILDEADAILEPNGGDRDNAAFVEGLIASPEFPGLQPQRDPVNVFIEDVRLESNVVLATANAEVVDGVYAPDATATLDLSAQGTTAPVAVEAFATLRMTRSDLSGGSVLELPLYLWETFEEPGPTGELGRYRDAYGIPANTGTFGPQTPDPSLVEWLPLGEIAPQVGAPTSEVVAFNALDRDATQLDMYLPSGLGREIRIAIDRLNVLLATAPPPNLHQEIVEQLRSFLYADSPTAPLGIVRSNYAALISSEIEIQIRPTAETFEDRFAEDNIVVLPITLEPPAAFPPPPPPPPPSLPPVINPKNPLLFNRSYLFGAGDPNLFAFRAAFGAEATADVDGLVVRGDGAVTVFALGRDAEFLGFDGRAQVLPAYAYAPSNQTPGFNLNLRALGQVIYEVPQTPASITVTDSFSVSKQFVGGQRAYRRLPIPISLTGDLTGTLGVDLGVTLTTASLSVTCEPYANLEASLEARASYGPFAVGAFGALTLAQEKFRVTSAASLEVLNSGANGDVARILLRPQLTVENELLGLVGRVALFAEYPMPDICFWDTFFGDIPYPCLRDARSEVNLLSFGGYRKYDRLINVTDDITLFSLNGETVFQ